MPRKKRAPERRGPAQPSVAKRSRPNRRDIEEEAEVRERELTVTCQLIKELGLDEDVWQPSLPCGRRFATARLNVTSTTTGDSSDDCWHSIGQVKLQADAVGISNVLHDHVHVSEVDLQLQWSYGWEQFIVVNAVRRPPFPPSSPLVFHSKATIIISLPAIFELAKLCRVAAVQLDISLPLTDTSYIPLTVKVGEKLIERGLPDAVYNKKGACTINKLAEIFFPAAALCQKQELLPAPVRQSQQSGTSCH